MSNTEKCRVDHLLLLVGKNPLPNAVAGKLLVKSGGSITLLHTKGTAAAAGRLAEFLSPTKFSDPVSVEEADAHSIYQGIFKALSSSHGQSVGLHYTGGTKAMSVHAYAAARRWSEKEKQPLPQFSYLDARTLHLVIDPNDPLSCTPQFCFVGDKVNISLDHLISLHGWEFNKAKPRPRTTPALPKTAAALAKLHSTPEGIAAWKSYCKDAQVLPMPTSDELKGLGVALREEFSACPGEHIEVAATIKRLNLDNKWLTGGFWLEQHVLQCLLDLNEEHPDLSLHDCSQGVKPKVGKNQDFDLDVVALRGYQLFAFSCGVKVKPEERGELKLKLFEAYVRARQLGGDEARVALVSTSADPQSLEEELERDINAEGQIKVFGQEHLGKLKEKLGCWIKKQSRIPSHPC
jgi:hypothetical protein